MVYTIAIVVTANIVVDDAIIVAVAADVFIDVIYQGHLSTAERLDGECGTVCWGRVTIHEWVERVLKLERCRHNESADRNIQTICYNQ